MTGILTEEESTTERQRHIGRRSCDNRGRDWNDRAGKPRIGKDNSNH